MPIRDPKTSKPTVEDLLRLKRAEQPAAEFWDQFEQNVRQRTWKQLVHRQSPPSLWHFVARLNVAGVAGAFLLTAAIVWSPAAFNSGLAETVAMPGANTAPSQGQDSPFAPFQAETATQPMAASESWSEQLPEAARRSFVLDAMPVYHAADDGHSRSFRTTHIGGSPFAEAASPKGARFVEDSFPISSSSRLISAKPAFRQF